MAHSLPMKFGGDPGRTRNHASVLGLGQAKARSGRRAHGNFEKSVSLGRSTDGRLLPFGNERPLSSETDDLQRIYICNPTEPRTVLPHALDLRAELQATRAQGANSKASPLLGVLPELLIDFTGGATRPARAGLVCFWPTRSGPFFTSRRERRRRRSAGSG